MNPGLVVALAVLAWLAFRPRAEASSESSSDPEDSDMERDQVVELIRERARAHGVDPNVALAFADAESELDPRAEGDLKWATSDGGVRYRKHVLNHPDFANHPDRANPEVWHSYGLFQLLSPFHTPKGKRPADLLDPALNTEVAMKMIARLFAHYKNADDVRLAYACGTPTNCSPEKRVQTLKRFHNKLLKWQAVS